MQQQNWTGAWNCLPEGHGTAAAAYIAEALRLLEGHDQEHKSQLAAFNQELGARLAAEKTQHIRA
jgi:hypothetical protein